MRHSGRLAVATVTATVTLVASLTGLVDAPATAAVGQVRAGGDYLLAPTATNGALSRAKAGPGLAVDPANSNRVLETHQDLAVQECETALSTDGGTTWTPAKLTAPAGFPATGACPSSRSALGTQAAGFGSGSRVYVAWTSSTTPANAAIGWSVLLSTSTDGGATFGPAVVALAGGAAPAPDLGTPEIVVDPRTSSTTDDRLFLTTRNARNEAALVIRSTDSGATFAAPVEASDVAAAAPVWNAGNTAVTTAGDAFVRTVELTQPALGPVPPGGGERPLYVGWVATKNSGACPPACEAVGQNDATGYLVVAKSADLGATWSRVRAVNVRGPVPPSGTVSRGGAVPRLAAGGGSDLYLTYTQAPGIGGSNDCGSGPFPGSVSGSGTTCSAYPTFSAADSAAGFDRDVYFLRSTTGGASWADLARLNDAKRTGLAAAEIAQSSRPQVFVAADGRVDVVWHDRRHAYYGPSDRKAAVTPSGAAATNYPCATIGGNCPEPRLSDTYYARSRDRGLSFTANRRLDDRSNNDDVGTDVAFGTSAPALAHVGTDTLLVANSDSRLGAAANNAQDVFLRKVSLDAGAGPVPVVSAGSGAAAVLSVTLSQRAYPGGGEAVTGTGTATRPWTRPVIVNEADAPAALAGAVLARANVGPVLASPTVALPAATKAEVDRLDPIGAYVIGDATKLSAQVEADLVAAGVPAGQVVRISGGTPADVAASIAVTLDRRRAADKTTTPPLPAFDAVVIANPNSASAYSASVLAANRRLPVLYVDQNAVPAATTSALNSLGITKTLVIGSSSVISNTVLAALPSPTRLGTGNQFSASSAVVTESIARGLPKNVVYVADGSEPMHGALLGSAVARLGGLMTFAASGGAAAAESAVNAYGLCAVVDRLVTSDLTGTAVVANDPGDGSGAAAAGPCPTPAAEAAPENPALTTFTPVDPKRILDTRPGAENIGAPAARVGAGGIVDLVVTGGAAAVPAGARAVVLNVTAVSPTASSDIRVYPTPATGAAVPNASNLNVVRGVTAANLVVVAVGEGGKVRLRNNSGAVDLLADIAGYYTAGTSAGRLAPVDPVRLLDTRPGAENIGAPAGAIGPGGAVDLQVTGAVVPAEATSVVLNVTAVAPTASTDVRVFPTPAAGSAVPLVSNINVVRGTTVPNLVIVKIGAGGKVRLRNNSGSVHLLADVAGYFTSTASGLFRPADPVRLLDTRPATKIGPKEGRLVAGETVDLPVAGAGVVPAGATAVVVNVTAVAALASTDVRVYPAPSSGTAFPNVSNLNVRAGITVPNLVVSKVGSGGAIRLRNSGGGVFLLADLAGWYQ